MSAAVRVRWSRGSEDVQVGQRQPICGTPNDVPVPRKISRTSHLLDLDEVGAARNVPRHSRRHHDAVALLREPAFENERSEEHTSELQSRPHLVCRLLLEKKKNQL